MSLVIAAISKDNDIIVCGDSRIVDKNSNIVTENENKIYQISDKVVIAYAGSKNDFDCLKIYLEIKSILLDTNDVECVYKEVKDYEENHASNDGIHLLIVGFNKCKIPKTEEDKIKAKIVLYLAPITFINHPLVTTSSVAPCTIQPININSTPPMAFTPTGCMGFVSTFTPLNKNNIPTTDAIIAKPTKNPLAYFFSQFSFANPKVEIFLFSINFTLIKINTKTNISAMRLINKIIKSSFDEKIFRKK